MRVLIVGGGVGGLGAARALLADGHEVVVAEAAPGGRDGGAALTLWSNGTGILGELGVSLDGVGAGIDVLEQRDQRGRLLLSVDVSRAAAHYGHPHLCLPRRRLLERLADGLPSTVLRTGRLVVGVAREADGVRVELADGTSEIGDVVVGADGRSSVVRAALWGEDPAEPSGWATWQGVTPIDHEVTSSHTGVMYLGPAGLCGLMPAGEGLVQWWFDQRWSPGTPAPPSPLGALAERFGSWAPPVRQVLGAVDEEDVGFFPHVRHRVPATWGRGSMTLVGDAAHSMPPTRAQGANQALEDAWALAGALRTGGSVSEALRAYERARARRVGIVAKQSGRETTNQYRPWVSRLVPGSLAARYYTRWLGQISTYLT